MSKYKYYVEFEVPAMAYVEFNSDKELTQEEIDSYLYGDNDIREFIDSEDIINAMRNPSSREWDIRSATCTQIFLAD